MASAIALRVLALALLLSGAAMAGPAALRERDVAYGSDPRQRFDVYALPQASRAPVIFMVHGGGWAYGDKGATAVVENKAARWVPAGFVFISVNYRMAPQIAPIEQARDLARALAAAQDKAAAWGGERSRFILMGHSAGAHLVALLNASPAIASQAGASPWIGTVALDGAAFDVPRIMQARHLPLFDRAFGSDPADWRAASPYHRLDKGGPPLLAVCSSQRRDSCMQAHRFAAKAATLGLRAAVLERDLSHRRINESLGEEGDYTNRVEAFMATLDPAVARLLAARVR
jgi:acetyl esterase/lipase